MLPLIFIGLVVAFSLEVHGLKCYEGSRGVLNGVPVSKFVVNQSDNKMKYCFESYNSNMTVVTASSQTLATNPKLIDICKLDGKCQKRTDIDLTICCCTSDLCNLQDKIKPTSNIVLSNSLDEESFEIVSADDMPWR